ncbi:uncharacterized protein VTP21DRAFT_5531 [Calcarisporiella thermophila]|uniref:uncharacterized protein n=1 Tax=Calcarisporiella thermophila TaxID=911321 RepID=UPI003743F1EC
MNPSDRSPDEHALDTNDHDLEASTGRGAIGARRQRSLTRPERQRVDSTNPRFHYINRTMHLDGNPIHDGTSPIGVARNGPPIKRGKSVLGRERSVRRTQRKRKDSVGAVGKHAGGERACSLWKVFYYAVTFYAPPFLLSACGKRTPPVQRAWREKMGLITIILLLSAAVGFLSFGFTQTACTHSNRVHASKVGPGMIVINGDAYQLDSFQHPITPELNADTNPFPFANASGKDISFLFQNVNNHCLGVLKVKQGVQWNQDANGRVPNYFPCVYFDRENPPEPDPQANPERIGCHTSFDARMAYYKLKPIGELFYRWEELETHRKNFIVYNNDVLNLDLLKWLPQEIFDIPQFMLNLTNPQQTSVMIGKDSTLSFLNSNQRQIADCLSDIIRVGVIEAKTMGCLASDVVLYLMLVVILGVVVSKFVLAVIFGWFLSWRLGSFKKGSREERRRREEEIEQWSRSINDPAAQIRPSSRVGSTIVPKSSRYSSYGMRMYGESMSSFKPNSSSIGFGGGNASRSNSFYLGGESPCASPRMSGIWDNPTSRGSTPPQTPHMRAKDKLITSHDLEASGTPPSSSCPFPLSPHVVPQPPPDFQPHGFPLLHTMCLVTCYSEGEEGIRTTLDSLATTDYPNSHKLLVVIADGMVKGAGNDLATPDIVLSMMEDLLTPADQIQAESYVAIADGAKRHNMAKVFAGFYKYDKHTVRKSKQQRVPMVLIAKCGTPEEQDQAKPGNRGKRDSQVMLMNFLQKVMFDERMTRFEYELFNAVWQIAGVSADHYEILLMVDADTKVFPDSLSRMVSCMERDHEVMGLCGETKIGNKTSSWVTMIQVFEYYISHHLSKAFESVFGGVTCLPGCFSMYRIKAPKGPDGYWVPILSNPDIIVKYSENVVDTLHKKNLLLLGEDRYLTTLMLSTFPKRKMIFVPQAVCKTVVPDEFMVLLSQRRRWINSTVHNLMELVLVRDLCGTFCFSMQFIVFMELMGTIVLPAAICFTLYLIIATIISPQSIISLVLLALVLGLPAVLIVMTSRKIVYVGWMLIYLISLPIWNFVLPVYAFWHFDDFSWGQTRMVEGEKKGAGHGEGEGEFDSSRIVMKRWVEFERERRGLSVAGGVMGVGNSSSGTSTPVPPSHRMFGTERMGSSMSLPQYHQHHVLRRSFIGTDEFPDLREEPFKPEIGGIGEEQEWGGHSMQGQAHSLSEEGGEEMPMLELPPAPPPHAYLESGQLQPTPQELKASSTSPSLKTHVTGTEGECSDAGTAHADSETLLSESWDYSTSAPPSSHVAATEADIPQPPPHMYPLPRQEHQESPPGLAIPTEMDAARERHHLHLFNTPRPNSTRMSSQTSLDRVSEGTHPSQP